MANRSLFGSATIGNVTVADYAFTATANTDWVRASGDWLFVAVECTVAGGSSPTCDITPEITNDAGTTVWSLPADNNSGTAAAMAQLTATANICEFWLNPLVGMDNWQWRLKLTKGGTISTFTINQLKYVLRTTAEELR